MWTNKTYIIDKVTGVNALMTDGTTHKLNDLLIVDKPDATDEKQNSQLATARTVKKIAKANSVAHVNPASIVTGSHKQYINSPFQIKKILDYDAEHDAYLLWFMGYPKSSAAYEPAANARRYTGFKQLLAEYQHANA